MREPGWRAQRQSGRACAREGGCVRVCVKCVCARAREWLGVRLFGELTGEPGPSRGLPDSAGCRGQPVLQPRPLNQPESPDLRSPCGQPDLLSVPARLCATRDSRGRGCGHGQVCGGTGSGWMGREWPHAGEGKRRMPGKTQQPPPLPVTPRTLLGKPSSYPV